MAQKQEGEEEEKKNDEDDDDFFKGCVKSLYLSKTFTSEIKGQSSA